MNLSYINELQHEMWNGLAIELMNQLNVNVNSLKKLNKLNGNQIIMVMLNMHWLFDDC